MKEKKIEAKKTFILLYQKFFSEVLKGWIMVDQMPKGTIKKPLLCNEMQIIRKQYPNYVFDHI